MKKQNTISKIRGALKHFTLGLAVSAALAVMSVGPMAQAIEIWGGPTISFTKADNADWTLEANQDRITPNVWLTRGNSMQLFNIKIETEAGGYGSDSPKDVEWAWQGINGNSDNPADIKAANYASLIFGRFDLIYNIPEVVSRAAVVHLITDDIYIEIQFTSWTQGAGGGTPAGGGFSYTRSTYSPPEPATITSFGLPGNRAFINLAAKTITMTVPLGTDFATLAPTFTVSSGTCDQTSGSPPSPTFAGGNPATATYTVTEGGTINPYTVTVMSFGSGTPTGEMNVRTYDTSQGTSMLDPIANLLAVTPSGTGLQTVDINYTTFAGVLPGITSDDTFSVIWDGWLDVTKSGHGDYTFGTASDDGSVVYVDLNNDGVFDPATELVVNNNYIQGTTVRTGTVTLNMNVVHVLIGFFEDGGGQSMEARFAKGTGVAWASMQNVIGAGPYFSSFSASEAYMLTFGANVAGSVAVITTTGPTTGTVDWTVPFGSTMATLAPTFTLSPLATCNQTNGAVPTPNFSTSPVHYIVTAEDGTTTRDYAVTVTQGPASMDCDITSFGANVAGSMAVITTTSPTTGTVDWYLPYGTAVAALAPTYTLSVGATCVPAPGTTKDFTSPQTYTVTAQDGTTTKDYTVTATAAAESALVWSAGGGGDWDFTTANWFGQTSSTFLPFANGLNVIFDATGVGGTINIPSAVFPLSTTVTNDSPVNYEFSGGPIAMGSLTKSGSGTLKIDGLVIGTTTGEVVAHTYSGGTIMNSGLLHLGGMYINSAGQGISPLCTGTVGTGPVTLNGGTIEFDRVNETNALSVFGGTLYSQNGWGATWSGPITLNATLTCNAGYTLTCSGAISGTGGLLKTGTSPLILSGVNSYAGPTTVTAGTLQCNNPDALGSGALSISSTTGTKVNLNYTGEHNVAALTLGGVPQTGGTYGSTASPATNKNDTYFAGTGMVRAPASSFKDMVTFSFGALGSATIAGTNITLEVPFGTDRTDLAPTYTVSPGATCLPLPGTHLNFTIPQVYTVTAEDLSTRAYRVTLTEAVLANVFTWTNTASGNWSVPANWSNDLATGAAPLAGGRSSYTLNFNAPGTYTATNNMNAGFQLNQLNLGGPTLTLAGNGLAFVTNGPTLPGINQNSGSAVAIPNGLVLANNTTFGGSGSGQVNLSGVLSGAGSLTKNGSGTLRIYHVNNSFTGGTIINSGTLTMDIDAKLGSGPITLNGGTLYMWRYHPTNSLTVNGGTLLSENGFGNSWDGPITLNATLPCNVLYTLICRGAISGTGGLYKTGNGPMTLSGVNTYTGPTTVTAGTLKCDNVNALGNGGGLSISGTAMVNLNYSGDHVVASLTLGGIAQPAGTYGSSGSGWGDDVHFDPAGTGTVTALASTANVMFNVFFPDLGYAIPVDSTGTNLVLYVASGTPVTALAPTYDVSPFASGSPAPATSRDFTTPQTYTITAENGSIAHYSVAVAPVAAGLGYSALVEATGPVAFWPLGELTGTTAVDVVGGHNATYSGTYTLGVAGLAPRSSAAAVDFVAGTATAPYSAALNPTQFSVECWVRPHNTTVQYLVSLQDRTAGGRIGYAIWKNNGSAGFGVMAGISTANNGVAVNGGTVAEAGKSYHVVGTYDGTTLKLYVNGNLEGSAVLAYMPATANQPGFTIASRNDATEADSDIQYVAVYNRALTAQEIQTHYQNTPILKIGTSAGQVLLEWEFGIGLQHAAPDVNGTYNDVLSATPPWPITPSGTSEFWRLKVK